MSLFQEMVDRILKEMELKPHMMVPLDPKLPRYKSICMPLDSLYELIEKALIQREEDEKWD